MIPPDRASAFVGLGSNLDTPADQVCMAIALLGELPGTCVERSSGLYRSAPVGIQDQPDFINAVCRLSTSLKPASLLQHLLAIEAGRGRVREMPGGPRVLDLDLLLYVWPDGSQEACRQVELVLPHPRLHERAFVLYPLYEVAPDLAIDGAGRIVDLMAGCTGQKIEKVATACGRKNAELSKRNS